MLNSAYNTIFATGDNNKNIIKEDTNKRALISESQRIVAKFCDRIPVIVNTTSQELDKVLDKRKYLVPHDVSCGYLLHSIRMRYKLPPEKAIFIFCNNELVTPTQLISELYTRYKIKKNIKSSDDQFLYLSLAYESTFGNIL